MTITRRQALGFIGSAVAAPYVAWPRSAAAAPIFQNVGSPIPLDSTQLDRQLWPRVDAIAKGSDGFIATWMHHEDSGDQPAFARFFDLQGAATSNAIKMGGPGPARNDFAIGACPVALGDGSIHIYFAAERKTAEDNDDFDVFLQRLTKQHAKVGTPTDVSKHAKNQDLVRAVLRSDGKVLAVYPEFNNKTLKGPCRSSVIRANGSLVSQDKPASEAKNNLEVSAVAALGRKAIVAITDFVGGDSRVFLQRLNGRGARTGDPLVLKQKSGLTLFGQAGLAGLPGGRAITAFFTGASADNVTLKVRLFQNGALAKAKNVGTTKVNNELPFQNRPIPQLARIAGAQVPAARERIVIVTEGYQGGIFRLEAWLVNGAGKRVAGPELLLQSGVRLVASSLVCLRNKVLLLAYAQGDSVFAQRFKLA